MFVIFVCFDCGVVVVIINIYCDVLFKLKNGVVWSEKEKRKKEELLFNFCNYVVEKFWRID